MTDPAYKQKIDPTQPTSYRVILGSNILAPSYSIQTTDGVEIWTVKIHTKTLDFSTHEGQALGTAIYHNTTTRVDFELVSEDVAPAQAAFALKRNKGILNETKSFEVAADGGSSATYTWSRAGKWRNAGLWNCTDKDGTVLAVIGAEDGATEFKFETKGTNLNTDLLIAIMMTGVSELEYQRRIKSAGIAGASAAAANAAAFAATQ